MGLMFVIADSSIYLEVRREGSRRGFVAEENSGAGAIRLSQIDFMISVTVYRC